MTLLDALNANASSATKKNASLYKKDAHDTKKLGLMCEAARPLGLENH